ncbi:tRNA (adenosine(37)-N6)-dimethylallyltransferase MiaA [Gallionella capsiferriformans]|uniref:tRNA dimethylallyltransferase n=1 Tax=Gallionella capsiferriformans (strain ES-2) TaxID=395494 RepID=D9SFP5_GALCS|nr:tRNA (adenosine(37)-N6)-dimethylallyltransferase MiaA [Gallionella capsiferriformans]ADL55342.1 tRNA delta(2)-isopentenylpyrophosphate transferase [Gallionella capsiferriformans ES-2]
MTQSTILDPESSHLPPALFLMGPTASGKTGVAVELAQTLPVELISVDSALVYRDMDIGTAKPDAATLALAPHHLINVIDPTEAYSAAAFRLAALALMADITARGKIPLLVGGTMLYFKALREGLSALPVANPSVRAELDAVIAQHGISHLHQQLAIVDPETAARLSPNDTQRIQRAMEIYRITGTAMSALFKLQTENAALPYQITSIALVPSDRSVLHQRIETRFHQMIEQGLLTELQDLRKKYALDPELPSMRCVGYRQAWQYSEGEITQAQFVETGIIATRQLAKRQLTWLRSMPENVQIDCLTDNLTNKVRGALRF